MVTLLRINVYRIFGLTFALGAATAGLAGVLAAPLRGVEPYMGIEALAVAFVVVVVGGMGSFSGALLAGLLVGYCSKRHEYLVASRGEPDDLCCHGARPAASARRVDGEKPMTALIRKYAYFLAALAAVLLLPLILDSGSLASEVLIFALAALGCNLLLGYAGLLSFGQGIFFGIGSYTLGILLTRTGLPMPLVLLAAAFMGAAIAGLVGWLAIRQKGVCFVMLTLALTQMFYFIAYSTPQWTGGDNGLLDIPTLPLTLFGFTLFPNQTAWQYYSFVALLFLLVYCALQRVVGSIFGRTLLAIRDNPARATALGYNIIHFKLVVFMLSVRLPAWQAHCTP